MKTESNRTSRKSRGNKHLRRARNLYFNQKYSEALPELEEAVALMPHSLEARLLHADVQVNLGDVQSGLEEILDLVKKNSKDGWLHMFAGKAYISANKPKIALEYLKKASDLKLNYPVILFFRSQAKHETGDSNGALKDINRYLKYDPSDPRSHGSRGVYLFSLGKFKDSIKSLTKAITLDSRLAQPYYLRGIVFSASGEPDRAIKDFTSAIRLDDSLAEAYYERGQLKAKIGDLESAIEDLRKAGERGLLESFKRVKKLSRRIAKDSLLVGKPFQGLSQRPVDITKIDLDHGPKDPLDTFAPNRKYTSIHFTRFEKLCGELKNQVQAFDQLCKEFPKLDPTKCDSFLVRYRINRK